MVFTLDFNSNIYNIEICITLCINNKNRSHTSTEKQDICMRSKQLSAISSGDRYICSIRYVFFFANIFKVNKQYKHILLL